MIRFHPEETLAKHGTASVFEKSSRFSSGISNQASFGILSTYPPTACGLATFAAALANGLEKIGVKQIGVVLVGDEQTDAHDNRVVAQLRPGSPASLSRAVEVLNLFDFVIIQHEFGIFGGDSGAELLDLMSRLTSPSIVTLHTVPLNPTPQQRFVLESVIAKSTASVTMTAIARERLLSLYDVNESKVVTIAHGANVPNHVARVNPHIPSALTWGLFGPGKGVEWVVDALSLISDLDPPMNYMVAGRTHPKVLLSKGEEYREMLQSRAASLGVSSRITFDPQYRSLSSLQNLVSSSTCVVLPYDSTEQITSGVLVDAIAAGRPVIATQFPHAVELLSDGAGILVPHKDPDALAAALRCVATRPDLVQSMSRRAAQLAPPHMWTAVARAYTKLAQDIDFSAASMLT